MHTEKFIFDSGDASAKNVNLPSQATANWSSSTLRSGENVNLPKLLSEETVNTCHKKKWVTTFFIFYNLILYSLQNKDKFNIFFV